MAEKRIVAELKRCLCEAQGRVVRFTMMDKRELERYRMSDSDRINHKARALGERNAYKNALKLLGVREGEVQELIDAVKIRAVGE